MEEARLWMISGKNGRQLLKFGPDSAQFDQISAQFDQNIARFGHMLSKLVDTLPSLADCCQYMARNGRDWSKLGRCLLRGQLLTIRRRELLGNSKARRARRGICCETVVEQLFRNCRVTASLCQKRPFRRRRHQTNGPHLQMRGRPKSGRNRPHTDWI